MDGVTKATACAAVVVIALAAVAAAAPVPPLAGADLAGYFPTSYFWAEGRGRLQARALTSWPGPTALLELWRHGELDEQTRVALLLGGAAFHDPQLLPAYAEALGSPSGRVRQAAVVGYRDLIGDRLPAVDRPVPPAEAEALTREIGMVADTLRTRPLVQLWLDTLLAPERRVLSTTPGVVLRRSPGEALDAVDRVVTPFDLPLLAAAYHSTADNQVRLGLLALIEGLTLEVFVQRPPDDRTGWSSTDAYRFGRELLDNWLAARCDLDPERVLAERLRALGAPPVADPFGAAGCDLWLPLLRAPEPILWPLAADRLYACGGPARPISIRRADQPDQKRQRDALLDWYRPRRPERDRAKPR